MTKPRQPRRDPNEGKKTDFAYTGTRRKTVRTETSDEMCPVCYSVRSEPCFEVLIRPEDNSGKMKRGKVLSKVHEERPGIKIILGKGSNKKNKTRRKPGPVVSTYLPHD